MRKSITNNGSINVTALGSGRNNQTNRSAKKNRYIAEAYKEELKKMKKLGSINYDLDEEDELE